MLEVRKRMNCEKCQELLSDFLDDAMTTSDRAEFSAHLEECLPCFNVHAEMNSIVTFCREHRGESAFTTWLHRLTVNQVLMHFRKRSVKLEQTTEEGETPVQIVKGTENPNSMPVVDRIALDKAIAQLPPGYRTVFVLHDVEGHEHEEIARMLGCSVGTSKSQLHKARMKLRGLLRQQNEA